jgi:hypothetical protein
MARLGFEPHAAALAVIEELAGIGRHVLGPPMAAVRAGDLGFQYHGPLDSKLEPACAQSAWIFAALTTRSHFSVSLRI